MQKFTAFLCGSALVATCAGALLVACGGSEPLPDYPQAPPKAAEPAVVKDQRPPTSSVWRDELIDSLNAGLGAFLQHVEVEASLEEGHFQGFRVIQLIPPGYWEGVELQPGDTVVSVNDMPIERETEAYAAFEALRSAREIRVKYLREGVAQQAVINIVERAGVEAAPAAPAAGASGATSVGGAPASTGAGGAGGAKQLPPSSVAPTTAAPVLTPATATPATPTPATTAPNGRRTAP